MTLTDGREVTRTPQGGPCSIAYVGGAAALFYGWSVHHTHGFELMEAMLDDLGSTALPDLVMADHGFAGAVSEAGSPHCPSPTSTIPRFLRPRRGGEPTAWS